MSKKKPESLTERQHFLLYEYKSTWFKLTSRKDAQDNQDKSYKLADLTRDYWRPKDRLYVLLVWLLLYSSMMLPGLISNLINDVTEWGRFWVFNSPFAFGLPIVQLLVATELYRYKILRKRLQAEWKDVPVIGEDGEPISKTEGNAHA